ncbi:MAG: efflux RND transporter periplasmic adaptor subunit [Acetobacteraceae bacterium]|jgi:multidrug efflux system membrane fusion protein
MISWRQRLTRALLAPIAAAAICHFPVPGLAQESARQGGPPTVPVSVAPVVRKDVPDYLRGLGTVLALQTVQLRSEVDGVLMKVPVTEGQDVKQGDVLAIIDPRPYQAALDAAIAQKQEDEAQLFAAHADVVRYTSLAAKQVASQQQLEVAQAKAGQLVASIAADAAKIDTAKINLAWCYIMAPFDGRVGLREVDPGNFIRSAEVTPVLPLSQLRPIAVTFTVPQDYLPAIQKAMAGGKLPVIAFTSDDKTELDHGTLLTIDNSIDATTGTIKLKAIFPNDKYQMWPGQFVNSRLLIDTSKGALTVPSAAVRHGQDDLFVYVVKPDQTVIRQVVEVERDDGVTSIITKGLEEGQTAVTDGQSRLQNGTHVSIINGAPKEAANPPHEGG